MAGSSGHADRLLPDSHSTGTGLTRSVRDWRTACSSAGVSAWSAEQPAALAGWRQPLPGPTGARSQARAEFAQVQPQRQARRPIGAPAQDSRVGVFLPPLGKSG